MCAGLEPPPTGLGLKEPESSNWADSPPDDLFLRLKNERSGPAGPQVDQDGLRRGLGALAAKANPSEGALSRAHCEALRVANGGARALRRPCSGQAAASTGCAAHGHLDEVPIAAS